MGEARRRRLRAEKEGWRAVDDVVIMSACPVVSNENYPLGLSIKISERRNRVWLSAGISDSTLSDVAKFGSYADYDDTLPYLACTDCKCPDVRLALVYILTELYPSYIKSYDAGGVRIPDEEALDIFYSIMELVSGT